MALKMKKRSSLARRGSRFTLKGMDRTRNKQRMSLYARFNDLFEKEVGQKIADLVTRNAVQEDGTLRFREIAMLPSTRVAAEDGGFEIMVRSVFNRGRKIEPGSTKVYDAIVRVSPGGEGATVTFAE